ncbi:hypothetical protein GYMLUDRAFT_531194 [Collybiopsis luxurians FD-317 M1]|nr:hypothetical protein GYMLUDRAFT_531194 [Collybiopsis luxurians FD-317 M1]
MIGLLRLPSRFYLAGIVLTFIVAISLLGKLGPSPTAILFPPEIGGAVEASRRPPKPPTWEKLYQWEDSLPQHDLNLPFPEGRTGRYVKFENQIKMLGWNNVLNEVSVISVCVLFL